MFPIQLDVEGVVNVGIRFVRFVASQIDVVRERLRSNRAKLRRCIAYNTRLLNDCQELRRERDDATDKVFILSKLYYDATGVMKPGIERRIDEYRAQRTRWLEG